MAHRSRPRIPERSDEILQKAIRADECAFREIAAKNSGLGHQRRPGLRKGRRPPVAARVVWRQRLLPLARIEGLQDARPRAALAVSLLFALPRLSGKAF